MYRQSFQTHLLCRPALCQFINEGAPIALGSLLEPSAEDSYISSVNSLSATQGVNGTRCRDAKFPLVHSCMERTRTLSARHKVTRRDRLIAAILPRNKNTLCDLCS